MKYLIATLAVCLSFVLCRADETVLSQADNLATKLQNVSVTIHSESGQGSGTIITRGGVNFVLTAGHVVEGNRRVDTVIEDGKPHFETRFTPVNIVKEIYVDGRSVGQTTVEGEVIAYSSSDYGQDLALIKLRSTVATETVSFSKDRMAAGVGVKLVHVGSLEGQEGSNSFTSGTVSQIGRVLDDKFYDQSSCPAFPGSSGGGMFLEATGEYIGMLVRGAGETFNLYIPIRRIHTWAQVQHIEFIFDENAQPDLSKIRLEDKEPLGRSPGLENPENKFKFFIPAKRLKSVK